MKAPEKIYVTPVRTWDTKHIPDLQDNIYISKDALLEFVNKKLQESADRLDFHANQAYAELIDKLNEM